MDGERSLAEAEFGNAAEARRFAASALELAPSARYTRATVALAFARSGDTERAQKLIDTLAKEFPQDTLINSYWLPMAGASLALHSGDPGKAVEHLRSAQNYELGAPSPSVAPLGVLYLRGYALLKAHQPTDAAGEFQRILEHPGIVGNSPVGALAHLGLGRALSARGDSARARTAYQDFLALWKDADPDIPLLKQAKAEYAKLQ